MIAERVALAAAVRNTGTAGVVRCLRARARLGDDAREVKRARAQAGRGDGSWRHRLESYQRGDVLIVSLTATSVIHGDGIRPQPLCYSHQAVWIGRAIAPQVLTERLRELARRDFKAVAAGLRDRGVRLSESAGALPVELSLDPALSERLSSSGGSRA